MHKFEPGPDGQPAYVPATDAQLRLFAIAAMASSLAHDLMQPLSAALNYLHVGSGQLRDRESSTETVELIERSTLLITKAVEIIRRMRGFVLEGLVDRRRESLRAMVDRVRSELNVENRLDADLVIVIDPDADQVMVDRVQVELVLTNLLVNASEAMAGSSFRRIEIRSYRRRDEVVVRVRDSGPGLTEQIHANAFLPFFTTKPGNSGLGLAICKAVVEANGGRLWAGAPTARGALFCLTLLAARSRSSAKAKRGRSSTT